MNIGDRVKYAEENDALEPDLYGTVAEPTSEELAESDVLFRRAEGDVMVDWDDGERYWESPESLVIVALAEDPVTSCATCGGRITPLRTSSTRYRHAPLLPKCPDHPPRPRPGLEDTLREAEPEEDR